MPSQGALIHSALIPKSCLWQHERPSIKFLQFLHCPPQLPSTKLVFCYMWIISFKITNNHCLNLTQKALVMVAVIRTKLSESCWRLPFGPKYYTTKVCNLQFSLLQRQLQISSCFKNWYFLALRYKNVLLNHQEYQSKSICILFQQL